MRPPQRLIGGGLAVVAVAVVAAVGVPAAHAGTYQVRYGGGQLGCGLFTSVNLASGYSNQTTTIEPGAATAASVAPDVGSGAPSICGGGGPGEPAVLAIMGGYPTAVAGDTAGSIGTTAPAGITITGVSGYAGESGPIGTAGWYAGDAYTGGGQTWNNGSLSFGTGPMSSSTWGIVLGCDSTVASCAGSGGVYPVLNVTSATFNASESQSPAISSSGSADLFNETGYVWNPPEDPWNLPLAATDPSGVCDAKAVIDGQSQTLYNDQAPDPNAWQQCPDGSWSTTVDTRQYVSGDGTLPLSLQATNAPGNVATEAQTIKVDNDPVSESLATPNDANPTVWINHAVQITATPSAGPSGVSGQSCAIDSGPSFAYPTGGFEVDGDGVHGVSCTAANGAVDPQGQPNTGSASGTVAIDEAPPVVQFAPVNPGNPDAIDVETSDSESGVASASLTVQGPHATSPTPVASTLAGGQLTANYDDAGKHGPYTFVATSCDQVGNCASISETLQFPIRIATTQQLSFGRIIVPATTVTKAVKLSTGQRTITRHAKRHGRRVTIKEIVRVKTARRVRVHIKTGQRCGHHKIRYRLHDKIRRRRVVACRKTMVAPLITHARRKLGHKIKLYGRVLTTQGTPIGAQAVQISTRLRAPHSTWTVLPTVNTGPKGFWTTTIDGGPSRVIRARYVGSQDTEPATTKVRLTVPAKIRLKISPHVVPWTHPLKIRGHLVGAHIPADGLALRLLVHYSHAKSWSVLEALRTNRHGAFHFAFSYGGGHGVASYRFRVATTAKESDYPYAPGASRPVKITFGKHTPHHKAKHRKKAKHHKTKTKRHHGG